MKDLRKMKNNKHPQQNLVNENMETLFDLEPGSTAQDKSNKVLRSKDVTDQESKQAVTKKRYSVKSPGRGGARPNAGRKKGATQKLSGASILDAIAQIDMPFEEGLALDYKRARDEGDLHVIQRYQTMILAKVVADKQELDVTSNGQTIGASFTFPSNELPDWTDEQPIKH